MTISKLSAKDIKKLAKENYVSLGAKFDIDEFTSDVNNLVAQGVKVADAMQIVGLKTMVEYAWCWQDNFCLYEIEVEVDNPESEAVRERVQYIIDDCTGQLESIYFDIREVFTDDDAEVTVA